MTHLLDSHLRGGVALLSGINDPLSLVTAPPAEGLDAPVVPEQHLPAEDLGEKGGGERDVGHGAEVEDEGRRVGGGVHTFSTKRFPQNSASAGREGTGTFDPPQSGLEIE